MADPISILGLAGSAIGGITGAIGASNTASATADAAKYQAQVARNNQITAQNNASYAAQAGAVAAQRNDMKNKQILGGIEAAQGASGIDIGSGTSEDVRKSAQQIGRLDTQTIMQNAMLQERSYEAQASNYGAQAGLDTMTAKNASSAGTLGVFSSLLGGASSFADKWMRYQNVGVKGYGSAV
jgi:hypothetical protein